jgi:hypothetical protein
VQLYRTGTTRSNFCCDFRNLMRLSSPRRSRRLRAWKGADDGAERLQWESWNYVFVFTCVNWASHKYGRHFFLMYQSLVLLSCLHLPCFWSIFSLYCSDRTFFCYLYWSSNRRQWIKNEHDSCCEFVVLWCTSVSSSIRFRRWYFS